MGFRRPHLEDKEGILVLLNCKKKCHLDTTVICAAAREEGIETYNTTNPEGLKIVQQTHKYLEEYYQDHKTK